jgi:hypothetical protein
MQVAKQANPGPRGYNADRLRTCFLIHPMKNVCHVVPSNGQAIPTAAGTSRALGQWRAGPFRVCGGVVCQRCVSDAVWDVRLELRPGSMNEAQCVTCVLQMPFQNYSKLLPGESQVSASSLVSGSWGFGTAGTECRAKRRKRH